MNEQALRDERTAQQRTTPSPSVLVDARVLALRHLRIIARRPATIVGVLLTPMVFAFLFFGVFGPLMDSSGIGYAQHLLPAIVIHAMLFNGISSAVAAAEDLGTGMVQRLRTTPIARSAPLLGWLAARVVVALFSLLLLVPVGALLGFRFHGGALGTCGFVVVVALLSLTVCAGYIVLGLRVRNLAALDGLANIIFFPLLLLSNAFTPTAAYVDWLQPVVANQPVSRTADLLRAFASPELPSAATSLIGLGWLIGLLVIFTWLGAREFGRAQ